MAKHKVWLMLIIILFVLVYLATLVINALANIPDLNLKIFRNSTGDISDKYILNITPANWTFTIWGIIYCWMTLVVIYCLTTICRKNSTDYVYVRPRVLTPMFYIWFMLNLGLNTAWLVLWDRELMTYSFIVLVAVSLTNYFALIIAHKNLWNHLSEMTAKQPFDVWSLRLLVHNGVSVYATWCTVATLLNTGILLVYWADLDQELAGTICLSILSLEVVIWFTLETFVLDRWTRYTLTIWPTIIWALSGILDLNWNLDNTTCIFSLVLVIVASCIFVFRFILFIWRVCNQPLLSAKTSPELLGMEAYKSESKQNIVA
ncbi:uncharacterized protein [Ptychodera flava]|uniref:uncharacterized protein n=1 Tax=Ptychodera flava TaxID=63121 RepID=UPI003969E970